MTVVILGARGKIAQHVATGLQAREIPVRLGTRTGTGQPARRGASPLPDGALEFDPADPGSILEGAEQVFLYADPATAPAFVAAADQAGVKQVVLLSSAASQAGTTDAAADPHGTAEAIVATGPYATTFLQPGAFMSNALFWGYSMRTTGEVRIPYLDAEEAPIHERDIADVAIEVLSAGPGAEHDGRGYELTGPESMTRRRQLELITEVLGVPVKMAELTPAEGRAELAAVMGDGPQLDSLMSYWASRVGNPHPTNTNVTALTGHPARPFTTWLTDHASTFTS
ncbi:SDR family oxidoreductase [Kribbella deserti]|uniref:SDR family oxidoreductase n=1 Tax=Kribbella deserti TaxID=1926257 RepID=A0ABV6QPP3_9ACTN